MSTEEKTNQEEIKNTEQIQDEQSEANENMKQETIKPATEELVQQEKDKYL